MIYILTAIDCYLAECDIRLQRRLMLITVSIRYMKISDYSEFDCWRLDHMLSSIIDTSGCRANKEVIRTATETGNPDVSFDYNKALAFLVSEGLLDEEPDDFTVTFKGKMIINNGGLVAKRRKEVRLRRLQTIGIVSGVVTGLTGTILSIIALLK